MENELDYIKKQMKKRKSLKEAKSIKTPSRKLEKYIFKVLIVGLMTVITLIFLKGNKSFNSKFYKYVYNDNFSFATINKYYQNIFGSPIPFKNLFKDKIAPVFDEKIKYDEASKYKDGVKLKVDYNYLVPALESGIVIFIGEKEEYGNTIIIQQTNGIDLWYSNIDKINVKLYDFVEKGSLLGEVKDETLYLIYQKDGKNLDYTKYLP